MENSQNMNKPRYLKEVDLLKFIAILGMIIIHVYENWAYSEDSCPYPDGIMDCILQFIGGPICAPLFMLACGLGVVYTRNNKPADYLHRGLILITMAYILNILRGFIIVSYLGFDEEELLIELLNVDILHLAGFSFVLIGILKCFGCNRWHVLACGLVFFAISNIVGVIGVDGILGYAVGLFFFTGSEEVCFPLFGWFIYIAIGVFLGSFLKETEDPFKLYTLLFLLGLGMFSVVSAVWTLTGNDVRDFFALNGDLFYRQNFYALAWIMGIVFMSLYIAYGIITKLNNASLDRFAHFYGKNLNRIYLMQWIAIGNISKIMVYNDWSLDPIMSVPCGILILAVFSALVPVYIKGVELIYKGISRDTGTF